MGSIALDEDGKIAMAPSTENPCLACGVTSGRKRPEPSLDSTFRFPLTDYSSRYVIGTIDSRVRSTCNYRQSTYTASPRTEMPYTSLISHFYKTFVYAVLYTGAGFLFTKQCISCIN